MLTSEYLLRVPIRHLIVIQIGTFACVDVKTLALYWIENQDQTLRDIYFISFTGFKKAPNFQSICVNSCAAVLVLVAGRCQCDDLVSAH